MWPFSRTIEVKVHPGTVIRPGDVVMLYVESVEIRGDVKRQLEPFLPAGARVIVHVAPHESALNLTWLFEQLAGNPCRDSARQGDPKPFERGEEPKHGLKDSPSPTAPHLPLAELVDGDNLVVPEASLDPSHDADLSLAESLVVTPSDWRSPPDVPTARSLAAGIAQAIRRLVRRSGASIESASSTGPAASGPTDPLLEAIHQYWNLAISGKPTRHLLASLGTPTTPLVPQQPAPSGQPQTASTTPVQRGVE